MGPWEREYGSSKSLFVFNVSTCDFIVANQVGLLFKCGVASDSLDIGDAVVSYWRGYCHFGGLRPTYEA